MKLLKGLSVLSVALGAALAAVVLSAQIALPVPAATCTPAKVTEVCVIHYVGTVTQAGIPTLQPKAHVLVKVGETPYYTNAKGYITFSLPKFHPFDLSVTPPEGYAVDMVTEHHAVRDTNVTTLTELHPVK